MGRIIMNNIKEIHMKKKIKYIILLFIVLGIFSKFVETSQDEFALKDVFISEYDSIKDGEKYITKKVIAN